VKQVIRLSVVLVLLSGGLIQAGEGRIPVWEPGTIGEPGHYILTRDIDVTGAEGIVIVADGVTLDLGGRTISLGDSSLYGIRVDLSDVAMPHRGVIIRNGRIHGGRSGIYVPSIIQSLRIDNIEVAGTSSHGIHVVFADAGASSVGSVPGVAVTNSHMHDIGGDGVMLADPRPSPLCEILIAGNLLFEIDGDGIELDGCPDGVIKDNMIKGFGKADSPAAGIRLVGGGGVASPVVGSNVISDGGTEAAGFVADSFSTSVDFLLTDNTISNNGAGGIRIQGGQGRIVDNTISSNGEDGLHLSSGIRLFVDGNYVADNGGYGFYFGDSNDHAFRDNFLRGNTSGALGGEPNTDAGGNIE